MTIPRWWCPTLAVGLLLWPTATLHAHASNTAHLVQSFFFDYNLPSQPVPIPVTAQCEKIHIKWGRSVATGPNPTAPYFLQVYTSTFVFPFIIEAGSGLSFDWAVPFAPGTQYQICMFDKNGNTGGCQATYTVIPGSSSCSNVTFPLGPLDIDAVVEDGPMSQYGWINQCTDISVTPKNGTPPYIFTIAPALHPPYNITSTEMKGMNWTVGLSWASSFFVSVIDAQGNSWANGPLHSGGNGPTACLVGIDTGSPKSIMPGVTVGVGVGGFVVGALGGIIVAAIFMQRRRRRERRTQFMDINSGSPSSPTTALFDHPTSPTTSHYRAVSSAAGHLDSSLGISNPSTLLNRMTQGSTQYQIEPFTLPSEDGRIDTARQVPARQSTARPVSRESRSGVAPQSVYVVHHDGGRAPVTVYHEDGTEVVELPPRYIGSDLGNDLSSDVRSEGPSSGSDGRSEIRSESSRTNITDQPAFLHQPRRPGSSGKPRTIQAFANPPNQ